MTTNCIITGATDGIGKQTALELAKLGYNLGLVGRNEKKGISVVDEIKTATGNGSVKYFNADLSVIKNIKHLSKSLLLSGYCLNMINFYSDSKEQLDMFIKKYPSNKDVAYAEYLLAMISYENILDEKKDGSSKKCLIHPFRECSINCVSS